MIEISWLRVEPGDRCIRTVADVRTATGIAPLWYEIPDEFSDGITIDRGDGFLVALLVEAMHRGEPLHIAAPMSATLMRNLRYYQQVMHTLYPALHVIDITCNELRYFDSAWQNRVLCAGLSGGVDAFSTVYDHYVTATSAERVQCLLFGNAAIGSSPSDQVIYQALKHRLKMVADEIGLPILFISSNLDAHTSPVKGSLASRHMSYVLQLQGFIHTYLNQGATPYSNLIGDTDGAGPLADHLLSTDATQIVCDGCQYTRIEKIARIADWPVVQKYLHVCNVATPDLTNCSHCTKCIATMLAIDMLGKRREFERVFDFTQFVQAKEKYVARNIGKATVGTNYLWRELVSYAEQIDYPLIPRGQNIVHDAEASLHVKPNNELSATSDRKPIAAFWQQDANFGDQLGPEIVRSFGFALEQTSPEKSLLVLGGSLLQCVPESFAGTIVGSGFLQEYHQRSFPQAEILTVRGRLSAERCRAPRDCLLADAGLLAPRLLSEIPPVQHALAIVPHAADQLAPHLRAFAERYPDEIVLVNVRAEPLKVLQLISSSQYVLSSSLYGLIAADALGKPNRWLLLSRHLPGGEFKFRDYYSAFNIEPTPLMIDGSEQLSDVLAKIGPPTEYAVERGAALAERFEHYMSQICLRPCYDRECTR